MLHLNSLEGLPASKSATIRPLLIVEAANPEWTSVPLVGWNLARAIARRTNGLMVTQIRNCEALLRAGLQLDRDFVAIDNERTAGTLHRLSEFVRGGDNKGWTVVTAFGSIAYYGFEREVWRVLGKRLRAGEFDLVHRITPLSPTSQSQIAHKLKKHNIPFVVGPLNGGVPWPANFGDVRSREREWLTWARPLHHLMPSYSATRTKAAAIVAGSRQALSELPASCRDRSFLIPENAADPRLFPGVPRALDGDTLKVAFIGRLVPCKGVDMLIEAIAAHVGSRRIELLIIGDGPQRDEIQRSIQRHKLERCIRLAGWVGQEKLAGTLSDYHVLGLPSVREFGGGVVLEAMSMGLVPVVANYGGPPELIDERSGIAVDFTDRASLVSGFTAELSQLANDPQRVAALSKGAIERVRSHFTWDAKAEQMLSIYNWVLGREPKPNFGSTNQE